VFNFSRFNKYALKIQDEVRELVKQKLDEEIIRRKYEEHGVPYSEALHGVMTSGKSKLRELYSQNLELLTEQIRIIRAQLIEEEKSKVEDLLATLDDLNLSNEEKNQILLATSSTSSSKDTSKSLGKVFKDFSDLINNIALKNQKPNEDLEETKRSIAEKIVYVQRNFNSIISGYTGNQISIIKQIVQTKDLPEDIKEIITKELYEIFPPVTKETLLSEMQFSTSGMRSRRAEQEWNRPSETGDKINKSELEILGVDLNNPLSLQDIAAAMSQNENARMKNKDQQALRPLFTRTFGKDQVAFVSYLCDLFNEDYSEVVDKLEESSKMKFEDSEYPGYSFSSKNEMYAIQDIRNIYGLNCIPSRMKIAKPDDFTKNKSHFIIDFVLYCNVVEFENNMPVNIRPQVVLIGEYFGYIKSDAEISKIKEQIKQLETAEGSQKEINALKPDLEKILKKMSEIEDKNSDDYKKLEKRAEDFRKQIENTDLFIKNKIKRLQAIIDYTEKTPVKEATEELCADLMNCKSISLYDFKNESQRHQMIQNQLNKANILYTKTGEIIQGSAYEKVITKNKSLIEPFVSVNKDGATTVKQYEKNVAYLAGCKKELESQALFETIQYQKRLKQSFDSKEFSSPAFRERLKREKDLNMKPFYQRMQLLNDLDPLVENSTLEFSSLKDYVEMVLDQNVPLSEIKPFNPKFKKQANVYNQKNRESKKPK
jgi:hypothetical protein